MKSKTDGRKPENVSGELVIFFFLRRSPDLDGKTDRESPRRTNLGRTAMVKSEMCD